MKQQLVYFFMLLQVVAIQGGPNLDGWGDEFTRCVAAAAGYAYMTPGDNGIYVTHCDGKSVLAFRGTDGNSNDMSTNIRAFFGGGYQGALDKVDWNGVDPNIKWDVCTGHSLGGGIAKRFASNLEDDDNDDTDCLQVITFGAPAIPNRWKPKKEKVREWVNYDRGHKSWWWGWKWHKIKDIVPTLVAGGHQNVGRLKNWPDFNVPHARFRAHSMWKYHNKFLGNCPSVHMVKNTHSNLWDWDDADCMNQDIQGCRTDSGCGSSSYPCCTKRYRCPTKDEVKATPYSQRWSVWDDPSCASDCRLSGSDVPNCPLPIIQDYKVDGDFTKGTGTLPDATKNCPTFWGYECNGYDCDRTTGNCLCPVGYDTFADCAPDGYSR